MDKESQVDLNQLFLETRNNANIQLLDAIKCLEATIRRLSLSQGKVGSTSSERKNRTSVSGIETDQSAKSKLEKVRASIGFLHIYHEINNEYFPKYFSRALTKCTDGE